MRYLYKSLILKNILYVDLYEKQLRSIRKEQVLNGKKIKS
jgi:hypothetical protein